MRRCQYFQVVQGELPKTHGFLYFLSPAPSVRKGWRNSWLWWTCQPANVTKDSSIKVKTSDLQCGEGGNECLVGRRDDGEGAEKIKLS